MKLKKGDTIRLTHTFLNTTTSSWAQPFVRYYENTNEDIIGTYISGNSIILKNKDLNRKAIGLGWAPGWLEKVEPDWDK